MHHGHPVPALDSPWLDHSQVCPGTRPRGEGPHPTGLTEPSGEGTARNAGSRDLQNHLVANPPPLPDQRGRDVDSRGRQVLAERPTRKRPPQLDSPDIQILAGIGVDGLFLATMMPQIADAVADQPTASR